MGEPTVWTVFLAALATALATGLGALPLLVVRSAGERVLGAANAAAAGVMLAASVGLAVDGARLDLTRVGIGALLGALFIGVVERRLAHEQPARIGGLRGEDARRGIVIVVVMTVHSMAEGIGVGAAFGGGATLGLLITVAIAVHNVPEGLAISLVLVPRGTSVPAAAGWSIFSSLPQPLLAIPAFLFVEAFREVLPVGLGFAAGAMVWMVARELVPDALRHTPARLVVGVASTAFASMLVFQALLR